LKWRNTSFLCNNQVENLTRNKWEGEKERARERGKRVRDSVWLRKGCGVSLKFDCWLNSSDLGDK
jgi:hypothetical protein